MLDFLGRIPWDHPLVQAGMRHGIQLLTGTDEASLRREQQRQMDELFRRHEELLQRFSAAAPVAAPQAGTTMAEPRPGDPLAPIIERLTVVGVSVDEALRFAREDGVSHPEAAKRIARAQEELVAIERHDLRPEVIVSLPPAQRAVVEGQMQALREARQALHNGPGGAPPTLESITRAGATIGDVATRLRVARAVGGGGVDHPGPAPKASSQTISQGPVPYSRYAPEMEVAAGCLPCGRAHLAGAVGELRSAAALAQERGMADPEVQSAVQSASEELQGLWTDDWTEEKIAASPPGDQAILREFLPRLKDLHGRLEAARTPEELAAVTDALAATREEFVRRDLSRAGAQAPASVPAMVVRGIPVPTGTHAVEEPPWLYSPPTPVDVAATTVPTDTARAFDQLVGALTARGVKVRIRNLWSSEEGVTEGAYVPETNTIVLGPAALAKDAYAVQVLAHEASHALNDHPPCRVYNAAELPYEERQEEQLARDVSVLALLEADLPVELQDGREIEPGEREIDWQALRSSLDPADYARLVWTARWVADAMSGVPRDYAADTCPPTALPEEV